MASKSLERLRKVGDRQTLSLTHYGRKSGRPYDVTIWYLVDKDGLYLISANAARSWVRNVKARPAISLRVGNEVFNGNVRAITDKDERDKVNDADDAQVLVRRADAADGTVSNVDGNGSRQHRRVRGDPRGRVAIAKKDPRLRPRA